MLNNKKQQKVAFLYVILTYLLSNLLTNILIIIIVQTYLKALNL